MFGIGLDDSFIIFGEYMRTDESKPIQDRVRDTFEEVGLSIFLTSLTTSGAFVLGVLSAMPAVIWLSFYACLAVVVDFIYQITFFVAVLVLDEQRIQRKKERQQQREAEEGQNNRSQLLCCIKATESSDERDNHNNTGIVNINDNSNSALDDLLLQQEAGTTKHDDSQIEKVDTMSETDSTKSGEHGKGRKAKEREVTIKEEDAHKRGGGHEEDHALHPRHLGTTFSMDLLEEEYSHHFHHHMPGPPGSSMDKFMKWYAKNLLRKPVKIAVVLLFVAVSGLLVYSATKFRQKFDIYEVLASDSYVGDFFRTTEQYYDRGFVVPMVYFRNVDQSDPDIQQQMDDFVNDLVSIDAITSQPPFCWWRHFKVFLAYDERLLDFTFNTQMDIFLNVDVFKTLYGDHIVRDPDTGDILSSRCMLFMDQIDWTSVQNQIGAFRQQMDVTLAQPINSPELLAEPGSFNFFLYESSTFYAWEFYEMMVAELIGTSVSGMVVVMIMAFLFLPHWSGVFILLPVMVVLYIDMIGKFRTSFVVFVRRLND